MILSFADADTEQLFQTERNRRFAAIARVALRKLIQLNQAGALQDLAVPPGNRLEALKGDLSGFHSIRVNDQWRIVFHWTARGAEEVAIVDYHR
jgi:proteic killer suppression protein